MHSKKKKIQRSYESYFSNIIFQAYKNNSQFPAAWLAWHIVDTFIKLQWLYITSSISFYNAMKHWYSGYL